MAEIELYIAEDPLCLEKVTLHFMGSEVSRAPQKIFEKADARMHESVDHLCTVLIEEAITQLEAIGEESDYLDLIYLRIKDVYQTRRGKQLIQYPFPSMEAALRPIMMEVAEPIAEKFYEELTNQLEELTDDELFSTYYLDDQQVVIQLTAPIDYEEILAIDTLIRNYHDTLHIVYEKIYPYIV